MRQKQLIRQNFDEGRGSFCYNRKEEYEYEETKFQYRKKGM